MSHAAERMRALGQVAADTGTPSSIFGSAGSLAQSLGSDAAYRISLYPILYPQNAELALGLLAALGYLLEQYPDVQVFRCLLRMDGADDDGEISVADMQFSPADWELAGLADNVQLTGQLAGQKGACQLALQLDTSLLGTDPPTEELVFTYDSLHELTSHLPYVAQQVMACLVDNTQERVPLDYSALPPDSANLPAILTALADWNLDVYLQFWDGEWADDDLLEQFADMLQLCQGRAGGFAAWCLGMMAQHVMLPGLQHIGEPILPPLYKALEDGALPPPGAAAAALGLAAMGDVQYASEYLQALCDEHAPASLWQALLDLQLGAGQLPQALETCQIALEQGIEHPAIAWQYAQTLLAADAQGWLPESLLLIDPDDVEAAEHLPRETVAALRAYLDKVPSNLPALQLALSTMLDWHEPNMWELFASLARQDLQGDYTKEIIDRLLDIPDYAQAFTILEQASDANPFAFVFTAQLALADGDVERAANSIAACRAHLAELDDGLELELQRLELQTRQPGFDVDYADIRLNLAEGRAISEAQVDLLEEAIGIAPRLVDLHVLLARCYHKWQDSDSALEVLAEAAAQAGQAPQLHLATAQILWAQRQEDEAMEQLNAGLQAFPNDLALLAQMARILINHDQLDDARPYLLRIETIAPSHPQLWQLRRMVAQRVSR